MLLVVLKFEVENKQKNCLGKTVFKIWSQICETEVYFSTKLVLEISEKKEEKHLKTMNTSTIFGRLLFFFSFLPKTLGCLETYVNCITNCVIA